MNHARIWGPRTSLALPQSSGNYNRYPIRTAMLVQVGAVRIRLL